MNKSEASHLLNSVLWIRHHLASPLLNCGHHFSALCNSSQTTSGLLNSSHNSSQLSSSFFISSHLGSTLLTSCYAFSTFPISSHLWSTLVNDSHLCPPLLSPSQLFSPLPTSFHRDALYRTTFTHRSFYTQKLLHRKAFTHKRFYTDKLLHREAFTRRSFCTEKLLHTARFYSEKRLHTEKLLHREPFTQRTATQRSFYTENLFILHRDAFTQRSFHTENQLYREAFTQRSINVHNASRNCSSKTGSRRQSKTKGRFWSTCYKHTHIYIYVNNSVMVIWQQIFLHQLDQIGRLTWSNRAWTTMRIKASKKGFQSMRHCKHRELSVFWKWGSTKMGRAASGKWNMEGVGFLEVIWHRIICGFWVTYMNSEMVLECIIAMAMFREVFSKIDIFTQQNGD